MQGKFRNLNHIYTCHTLLWMVDIELIAASASKCIFTLLEEHRRVQVVIFHQHVLRRVQKYWLTRILQGGPFFILYKYDWPTVDIPCGINAYIHYSDGINLLHISRSCVIGVFPRDHDLIMINSHASLVIQLSSTWITILFLFWNTLHFCMTAGHKAVIIHSLSNREVLTTCNSIFKKLTHNRLVVTIQSCLTHNLLVQTLGHTAIIRKSWSSGTTLYVHLLHNKISTDS